MSEFVRICLQSEVPAVDSVKEFSVDGKAICVANVEGAICVLDGTCPHEGGPLGEGTVEDGRVVCPWHAIAFDVHTGAAQDEPDLRAQVFEAKVEGGALIAKL